MGWTVLYIAFGIVALWLLGEVLLQYKARLRWRMLAFVGFLGVVLGVLMPSIVVIAIGAATFAAGQTFVTLSFRRGFSTGWAIGGSPGASRRRKTKGLAAQDPTLEVLDLEYAAEYAPEQTQNFPVVEPQQSPVYAPEPMPDETGQYGVYQDSAYPSPPAAAPADGTDFGYDGYSTVGYDQQNYGYDTAQPQYAAYSDPYIGSTQAAYGEYDTYTGQQQGYDPGYQDPYTTGYPDETPPGGGWVPQQRNGDEYAGGELPPEQPYPYENQGGYDTGYNEQQPYRY